MSILNCLPYPWYLASRDGKLIKSGVDTIFTLPKVASSAPSEIYYRSVTTAGWSVCPNGFSVYAREVSDFEAAPLMGGMLLLPGLRVKGGGRMNEKADNRYYLTDRADIVLCVDALMASRRSIHEHYDLKSRQLVHEIRGINAGIYHSGLELEGRSAGFEQAISRNISSLSQVISGRLDLISFLDQDDAGNLSFSRFQLYKKYDSMNRCFLPSTARKGVTMALKGRSHGVVYGPSSLADLAAYMMIENAIKYAPRRTHIDVIVDDVDQHIRASVVSVGPRIDDDEKGAIFEMGYRGRNAIASMIDGTGIGLFALKKIISEGFAGQLEVDVVEGHGVVAGVHHDTICFTAMFPRAA